ncbi:MAG TPA: hypothetical protein VEU62_06405 [Bryobacterales bacterium]|nr:hypothetical protein [Bryobacterales bacterium]
MSLALKTGLLALGLVWSQEFGAGQAALESAAPRAEAPVRPLIYQGRPLRVPLTCRAEGFEAAGIECSDDEPCRIFLELNAVDAIGPKIFLVGDLHTSSATVYSLALASNDAGTTWKEPLARLPAAGFEAMQFINDQQGWIVVQPQEQFPADPYLLATTDGGAHWEKLLIWSEQGRGGVLQQFYFESKDHGFVLIDRSQTGSVSDRYELYETMTGGSSWMLKETGSKPITTKWPARQNPDWRIREDAKLKTLELERRVSSFWKRMANFRTEVGICKALEAGPKGPESAPETAPPPTEATPTGAAATAPTGASPPAAPADAPKAKPAAPPTLKRPSERPDAAAPNR